MVSVQENGEGVSFSVKVQPRAKKNSITGEVGGGPTGVELAGSIAEIAQKVMAKDFRGIDPTRA